jgi:hypothetical protein
MRKAGEQIHHVIPHGDRFTKNHELLKEIGFNLKKEEINQMLLPTSGIAGDKRTLHMGMHKREYSELVASKLDDIQEQATLEKWDLDKKRKAVEKLIADLKQKLETGKLSLNSTKGKGGGPDNFGGTKKTNFTATKPGSTHKR